MNRAIFTLILAVISAAGAGAERFELFKYGDFNQWVTRNIPESAIIGGKTKSLYEIGPTRTVDGAKAYVPQGGSPWATSNVYARVAGINKASNAVFADTRSGSDKCAKLTASIESCKALGIVNIDVMVGGSIFLGRMFEPITSTSNPYSKMEMGVPFTGHPKALRFDYRLTMPTENNRIYSSGFGKKKTIPGHDSAEVMVLLQRRWEDADGNIYAKRVGTGRILLSENTSNWVNGFDLPILYGDITSSPQYKPFMNLIPKKNSYYARNSKGQMVPVVEVGWDAPDATPTHIIMMASAASGEAYVGTPGLTFWIDNVGLVYDN